MAVGQPLLTGSIVGHGGVRCSDASHLIVATVGQTAIGHGNCPSHIGDFGFWYAKAGLVTALGPGQIAVLPAAFRLEQNYPNPFNPATVVSGQWPVTSAVRLVIYDVLGREVAVLADGQYPAGKYSFTFNASGLASGVYFYRLTANQCTATKGMLLEK